jgi:glutathione S-transferase
MAVVLYQFDISPFCDKVRRLLNLKGVTYETRDPRMTEMDAFKKKSPARRLPVLDHDGTIIADSSDIARFLEETYPAPRLIPADPAQAAQVQVLEDWADESLYFFELTMRLTWETNAPRIVGELMDKAGAPALMKALAPKQVMGRYGKVAATQGIGAMPRPMFLKHLGRNLDAVEGLLGDREWLVGNAVSLADIAVYAQVVCIEGTVEGGSLVADRPGVGAWLRRVDMASGRRR